MIHRVGRAVTVLERSVVGTDEFNNPEHEWVDTSADNDPPIKALRTYPNRNRQNNSAGGPYDQDRPLFMFTPDEAPDEGARIIYDNETYELGSGTVYDTHVAFLAKHVTA
jgi:hypothetical protein